MTIHTDTRPTLNLIRLPHGEGLDMPAYETKGAAGMDLRAALKDGVTLTLAPGKRALVPSGFIFEIPEGYREVEDFASAMSAAYANPGVAETGGSATVMNTPTQPAATSAATTTVTPKREGVIRFGVAAVKAGNVAEWMNAQTLAAAVQNTLQQNLKGTNVEAVLIEATGAAIQAEAQQKQCDYIVFANVSHKKGGGGFGSMLSSSVGQVASNIGYGSGTAAVVATNTVVAATVAQNIKNKDELTLDVRLERPTSQTPSFAQTFKGKAKSAGEDIITPLSQQAAQGIISSVTK